MSNMFDPAEFYYLPVDRENKNPLTSFGGWPIDPHNSGILTYEEMVNDDWTQHAIVGNKTQNLLVVDVDLHKMSQGERQRIENDNFGGTVNDTTMVRTPSGGFHLYYIFEDDISEFEPIEHVDLGGDVGKRYMKSPFCDKYELVQNKTPLPVDRKILKDFLVFQEDDSYQYFGESEKMSGSIPPCIERMDKNDDVSKQLLFYWQKTGLDSRLTDSIYSVLDKSEFPPGERVSAPEWLHTSDSQTNANFMVDENQSTFRCWRHDVTGHAGHLIAIQDGIATCNDIGNFSKTQYAQMNTRIREEEDGTYTLTCDMIKNVGKCPFQCRRNSPYDV